MKLIDFSKNFPTEESCRTKFKEYRDHVGVVCPKCGCTVHYWIGGKNEHYQCKECGFRQSLRSHTVMHHSHLSFQQWFLCMHLLTSTKSNLSAAEIQRQMGRKHYRCVWEMIQKIRNAMHKRECEYQLQGEVEIDEAFFDIGEDKLIPVLVMAESKSSSANGKTYSTPRCFGHLKMLVMHSKSKDSITFTAKDYLSSDAILQGDGTASHNGLKKYVQEVKSQIMKDDDLIRLLPWVHISIGHSKNSLRDIYHSVTRNYLQLYLSEFCWKKNRRNCKDLFNNLVKIVAMYPNDWWPDRKCNLVVPEGLILRI